MIIEPKATPIRAGQTRAGQTRATTTLSMENVLIFVSQ